MNMNNKQKAILYLIAIIWVFAICIYLISINILHPISLFAILFGCYPWGKFIWGVCNLEKHNTTRILKRILPKCGFSIEKTEWDEEHTFMRIYGVYQGDHFIIEASTVSLFIKIYDLVWHSVQASDPSMRLYLEAINETNAAYSNLSVIMCEPDEKDMRDIYTASITIIPDYQPHVYLDHLMCDMLNCKKTFAESVQKDRPWLKAKRGPIGFNTSCEQENSEKTKISGFAANAD